MIKPSLFIFAGELSGDLHGSHLLKAIKQRMPAIQAFGVGGPALREAGLNTILPMEKFEVMGFTDVLLALPRLYKQFHQVRRAILETDPRAVVLIDYPGFNLRLASSLRKAGFKGKIAQYISPTVWAHGKNRIQQMAQSYDIVLAILPFEPSCYTGSGLKAVYVGNPLQEYVNTHSYENDWKKNFNIPVEAPLISLFPGSRHGEVKRNLPAILTAAQMLRKECPEVAFAISCAHPSTELLAKELLPKNATDVFFVPKKYAYEMMRDSQAAVAKSGTVTLELALHACPTVVIYQLTALNKFMAKWIMKLNLPHYALANIVAGCQVFPELIAKQFSPADIYAALNSLINNSDTRRHCLDGCDRIKDLLKDVQASRDAAAILEEYLTC